ncbi:CMP-N-acetylneuraminate-beta-galactosamide-alpha-2,3-sialyltransferase 2-like [Cololabis saira]|uniref:CMP-N-acetylneuraminate-beta-galactosamide- alpha-2,3-sialyltransferase 2-like n=1 Tax=Cololabis saira TaxID=129043 RepID=UPI002AD5910A|nr:CMP-N-acetylneuraminate-beta-galactosamide-alpha-2,3-sialyltransferase 2-like [Cololabis saira]
MRQASFWHQPPIIRPAMLLRRKLCVALVIAAVLLLMLASHNIQRRHFQPKAMVQLNSQTMPIGREMVVEPTAPPAVLTRPPATNPDAEEGEGEEEEGDDEEEEEEEEQQQEKEPKVDLTTGQRPCGCSESCISDVGGSDWFSQRYDGKQEPILRNTKQNFDPDALTWWLSIQRSGNDKTLEEVMSQMFQVVSSPTVDTRPLPSRCRRCAVVGNSGNLRKSGHGKLIDSHTSVIRMNKAVTQNFESDVGNRTTHHFLYPESAVDVRRGVSVVLLPFKLRDLEWLTSALSTGDIKMTYMRVKERIEADKDKVLVVNPVFFKYVHDRWTEHHGRYPSTGMLAIIFALHTCDQVSVFGYGADQQGNWHHYWEENRYAGAFRKTGVHSADFETGIIHQLADKGKITLHL